MPHTWQVMTTMTMILCIKWMRYLIIATDYCYFRYNAWAKGHWGIADCARQAAILVFYRDQHLTGPVENMNEQMWRCHSQWQSFITPPPEAVFDLGVNSGYDSYTPSPFEVGFTTEQTRSGRKTFFQGQPKESCIKASGLLIDFCPMQHNRRDARFNEESSWYKRLAYKLCPLTPALSNMVFCVWLMLVLSWCPS